MDFLREPTFDNETGEIIDAHPSFYESIQGGLPDIRKRVEALQRKFNEESKAVKLELVLFQDALTHLMRISRLLAMDRGSVLLVGVGGSGKQSLSRLAAYIAGQSCLHISLQHVSSTKPFWFRFCSVLAPSLLCCQLYAPCIVCQECNAVSSCQLLCLNTLSVPHMQSILVSVWTPEVQSDCFGPRIKCADW